MKQRPVFGCFAAGYTLLEIVIVLALLGLMAGLALPRMEKLYTGVQHSMQRSEVLRSLANLGYQAWSQQKSFVLIQYPRSTDTSSKKNQQESTHNFAEPTELVFSLPEDWRVTTEHPVIYRKNGICSGGIVTVGYQDIETKYTLAAPFCVPEQMAASEY